MIIWAFIILFFLILATLALINFRLNKEFKIETSWLALGLAPVVIWLITTQQLSEFSGFGLAFKLNEATSTPVSLQIDGAAITAEKVSNEGKQGLGKLEEIKRKRVAAITLEVGRQGYYLNRAIKKYLEELTPLPFFKFVIFKNKSGEFQGIIPGINLLVELRNNLDLVPLIESGNISGINGVSTISAPIGSSKKISLQLMDKHGLSVLPVVDHNKSFIGIVDRGKITSSIVAQLVS